MSGGKDRRSRASKTQGWEEAGGEFYQESYPGDLEGMQRDPSKIATLLPSKQTRVATTRRVRPNNQDTKGTRRRTSVSTVARRGSQYHDIQVATLPDLSENLINEERTWEEIREIKSMPVPMAQKREMKAQLQNATKLRLQGFEQIKWQRRKAWQRFHAKWTEYLTKMELWRTSLKTVEGNFGTGVVAYFLFLRWLMFLNLIIFILIFLFIVLPHILLNEPVDKPCDLETPASIQCCSENYLNETKTVDFSILDIIQGTGFMEATLLFYGMYTNQIYGHNPIDDGLDNENFTIFYYDLPLVYIIITAIYYLITLIAIVKAVAREFKDRLVEGEGQFYQYCNLIFGGWDFCIHNEKSADIKHKALHTEVKSLLHTKRFEYERNNRSRDFMIKLIMIRLFINLIVCVILLVAAYIIYYLFNKSLAHLEPNFTLDNTYTGRSLFNSFSSSTNNSLHDDFSATSSFIKGSSNERLEVLFYEFLPYIAIVCLNLLVPLFFNYLVGFEKYSPLFVIKMTLFRTVFLRLSSLGVLLSRFYFLISTTSSPSNRAGSLNMTNITEMECYNKQKGTPQCWETFVGQQFYKLFIVDFVTHAFVTFFVNLPRALCAKHSSSKFAKFIGEQEFELSKHVLDIVYSQTLCWLGSFYAPFLPAIAAVLNFFMFYIKKFACLINSKPSSILYRASRSNSLFMFILLISFTLAVIPVVYAIAEIMPSRSCGPFRGLDSVWDRAINAFMKMPEFFQNIIFFFGTASFAIPCFILLTLFLYYYYAVSAANKHMVQVLKNQLVLEGHDKQFLLSRLSMFIKQQQDFQKRMRQSDANNMHQQVPRNDRESKANRDRDIGAPPSGDIK